MAIDNGVSLDRLTRDRLEPKEIDNLLAQGQYKELAALLLQFQAACQQKEDEILADILAAAGQICSACDQCKTEMAWHEHATKEARQREQALKHELGGIVNLVCKNVIQGVGQKEISSLPAPTASKTWLNLPEFNDSLSSEHSGLLQRVQNWLHLRGISELFRDSTPATPAVIDPPAGNIIVHEEHNSPMLGVHCLGPFRVYRGDRLLRDWSSRKAQAIFKYLITHRHVPVSKDILMDIFWPDADPEAARRNLHQAIYALRQTLKVEETDFQFIRFENDRYRFASALTIWLDVEEFEQHVQMGRKLEQNHAKTQAMAEYGIAEGLYEGDFMAEELYEDWPQARRQSLWQTYLSVAYSLAQYYLDQREYAAATALGQRILARDNCQEKAHQILMRCYLAQGQRHLVARQFQLCAQALQTELELTPSAETQMLYKRIAGR